MTMAEKSEKLEAARREQAGAREESTGTGSGAKSPAAEPRPKAAGAKQRNIAWRRLGGAFRPYVSRAQIAGATLLAVLGFAATIQVQALRTTDEFSTADQSQLVQILDGLQQRTRRLESDISELQQAKSDLVSGADRSRTAVEQAQARAQTLGILAGTLPATGPGIRLTISDNQAAVDASLVLNTIEELRDAGAESIEVNDRVRVVAASYFLNGQGGIIIDNKLIPPPYTIDAIGDTRTLATAMRIPGGVVDEVSQKGGLVTVLERQTVQINSLHNVTSPRYARPAPEKTSGATK
ncbi:uncharacterized protein YlxW (UPF0749 family) [Actinopolymorpha pittospori]|uniref:Uncharacterized protein YlxW (UPF0749 family) n=1 Tax=Actinopolymorpha pittospori TaxID=648752 RepID=A0A927N9A3_9ACTN|nr:uncharacterized protein YlxW (UPF0749 family) [Actinopolymorpha pittospori]